MNTMVSKIGIAKLFWFTGQELLCVWELACIEGHVVTPYSSCMYG